MRCRSRLHRWNFYGGGGQKGEADMKALVIPDVHLKPYMFKEAAEWMRKGVADRAVCLMDIPDDWNREYDIELYAQTLSLIHI